MHMHSVSAREWAGVLGAATLSGSLFTITMETGRRSNRLAEGSAWLLMLLVLHPASAQGTLSARQGHGNVARPQNADGTLQEPQRCHTVI